MFNWFRKFFSTDPEYELTGSLPFDEIQERYEEWSASRSKYIEENQQRLERGECTWDDFTDGLADIEQKMLSEPDSRAQINAIVNDLCRAFLAETPNRRVEIQDFVADRGPLTTLIKGLPGKMATELASPNDVDKLLCGLAAMSIKGGEGDWRDTSTVLAEFFVRAEEIGKQLACIRVD